MDETSVSLWPPPAGRSATKRPAKSRYHGSCRSGQIVHRAQRIYCGSCPTATLRRQVPGDVVVQHRLSVGECNGFSLMVPFLLIMNHGVLEREQTLSGPTGSSFDHQHPSILGRIISSRFQSGPTTWDRRFVTEAGPSASGIQKPRGPLTGSRTA